jgi:hypothetical protein
MIFSDVASPAEALTEWASRWQGFAQAHAWSVQRGQPQLARAAGRHDAAIFICIPGLFAFLGGAVEGLRHAFE